MGVTVNKNAIPFDPESPNVTSGIRLGTPAITTRGFTVESMQEIADIINWTLTGKKDLDQIRGCVRDLCQRFPLYNE
jgi:glycine hydroxymethyltransferase